MKFFFETKFFFPKTFVYSPTVSKGQKNRITFHRRGSKRTWVLDTSLNRHPRHNLSTPWHRRWLKGLDVKRKRRLGVEDLTWWLDRLHFFPILFTSSRLTFDVSVDNLTFGSNCTKRLSQSSLFYYCCHHCKFTRVTRSVTKRVKSLLSYSYKGVRYRYPSRGNKDDNVWNTGKSCLRGKLVETATKLTHL